ncbi:MAG: TIGR00270 family protein [Candidatus Thermoplasmatota archaeon]|nr:TIGR00270 family protein [Candidatus Thermoplasmatota archaeon]
MSDCERCGRKARLQLVEIEGARMYVCPDCTRFGNLVKVDQPSSPPTTMVTRPRTERTPKPDALTKRTRELAEDYPRRIQRAREKKGWSREDLGRKLNERVSIITKLENGEMHPPDSLIKKLERTLEVKLMEDVEEVHVTADAGSRGMTLADFIVYKDR